MYFDNNVSNWILNQLEDWLSINNIDKRFSYKSNLCSITWPILLKFFVNKRAYSSIFIRRFAYRLKPNRYDWVFPSRKICSSYLSNDSTCLRTTNDARWPLDDIGRRLDAIEFKSHSDKRKCFKILSCIYMITVKKRVFFIRIQIVHMQQMTCQLRIVRCVFKVSCMLESWYEYYLNFFHEFYGYIVHVLNGLGLDKNIIEQILYE